MRKLVGLTLVLICLALATSGCHEQKFPHGQQAKPDNVEEKK
jgi:hypothetical protein